MSIVEKYKKVPLLVKLFVALILGAVLGIAFGEKIYIISPIGTIFLNLLKMAALPLIIVNLIAGISSLGDPKTFGRLGGKILLYYFATTAFAMLVALVAGFAIKPGLGFVLTTPFEGKVEALPTFGETIINLLPSNIFKALADGRFDQIVVFSAFVGVAILLMKQAEREYLSTMFQNISNMFSRIIGIIMGFAPFGICALIATTVAKYGNMLAGFLAKYLGATYISVVIMICIYMVLLFIFTRMNPLKFLKGALPLMITSLSTSSSIASVPISLNCADSLGVPRKVSAFTIPLGAQVNKDGNAIMLAMTFLFAVQAIGGDLSLGIILKMLLLGLILTTGSGGVPGGGIVTIAIMVDAFNLPLEVVGIVSGIFVLIDMVLTMLNCLGDLAGTVIVAKSEKKHLEALEQTKN